LGIERERLPVVADIREGNAHVEDDYKNKDIAKQFMGDSASA
jgi:hypothetical protein